MLTKNTPSIKKARRLLSQYMRPNIVKFVELDKDCRTHTKLIRVFISQTKEGMFAAGIMRVGHKMDIYATTHTPDLGLYEQRYFAEEKLEELVTVAEQEGFDVSCEMDEPIVDLFKIRYQSKRPVFSTGIKFFHAHRDNEACFFQQPIPSGLHVLIKVNQFGEMCVHDFQSENVSIDKENLIVGRVKAYLKPLMQKDGFRGALMDGYFDGKSVYIVDAGYLHNKSLFGLTFEKRCIIINNLLASLEQHDGCRFIYPIRGKSSAWLETYRHGLVKSVLVKHQSGLFCVQPSSRFDKLSGSMHGGYLLSESEKLSFIGNKVEAGEMSMSLADNIKQKGLTPYPSKECISRPNEYDIIGYNEMSETVPIIF